MTTRQLRIVPTVLLAFWAFSMAGCLPNETSNLDGGVDGADVGSSTDAPIATRTDVSAAEDLGTTDVRVEVVSDTLAPSPDAQMPQCPYARDSEPPTCTCPLPDTGVGPSEVGADVAVDAPETARDAPDAPDADVGDAPRDVRAETAQSDAMPPVTEGEPCAPLTGMRCDATGTVMRCVDGHYAKAANLCAGSVAGAIYVDDWIYVCDGGEVRTRACSYWTEVCLGPEAETGIAGCQPCLEGMKRCASVGRNPWAAYDICVGGAWQASGSICGFPVGLPPTYPATCTESSRYAVQCQRL